jgi:hypothetical protein
MGNKHDQTTGDWGMNVMMKEVNHIITITILPKMQ